VAKRGVVIEEADESAFWLDLIGACGIVPAKRLASLITETDELLATFVAPRMTAKKRGRLAIQH
jgi:hypothetical protein